MMYQLPPGGRLQATRRAVLAAKHAATRELRIAGLRSADPIGADAVWQATRFVPGWLDELNGLAIAELVRLTRPAVLVEIGSYLGRSTVLLAVAARRVRPDAIVAAVDPHTGDRQQLEGLEVERVATEGMFRQHVAAAGVADIVRPIVKPSLEAAAEWAQPIDFLYVDGWHSYDAVLADGEAWAPHLERDAVVVFDDYFPYPEVAGAIHELDRRGVIHLWTPLFGQALGGSAPDPPPPLESFVKFVSTRLASLR